MHSYSDNFNIKLKIKPGSEMTPTTADGYVLKRLTDWT